MTQPSTTAPGALPPPRPSPRPWQRMLSGRRLDLFDPDPADIEIVDIAHGLARVARWNGQTDGAHAFSVAQHSVLVDTLFCALADREPGRQERLAALLHDAPEFVLGDLISPFKAALGNTYRALEARLLDAVGQRFACEAAMADPALKSVIKTADRISAYYEAVELVRFAPHEAAGFFGTPPVLPPALQRELTALAPQPAEAAQRDFLQRFAQIAAL
ncbi:MAG: YfbR-like 5'-deoxynucleotidase [Pseudomonadota bacterium]